MWKVNKVEVSKNFLLESPHEVTQYINKLSEISLPRKTTIKYSNESVYFKNKSQTIKFYNKFAEMRKNKCTEAKVLSEARNVLRFEVEAKGYTLRNYTNEKKAVDILTKDFFELIMSKNINLINNKITCLDVEMITPTIFNSGLTNGQIESSLAIMLLTKKIGESTLKCIYSPSTLHRKQGEVRTLIEFMNREKNKKVFLEIEN